MKWLSGSSLLHALIAVVFSAIAWIPVGLGVPELAVPFAGALFFYGREMKEYQKWREKQNDGSDNVLQLKDLNPLNYTKGGRGDGFLDVLYPVVASVLLGVGLLVWRLS